VNIRLVVRLLARVLLLAAACCLFWSALPALWGWTATTVMSDSMAPAVRAGDIVVTMPLTDPAISLGHVILVDDPDHEGRLRLHRLVDVTADGQFTTQGDANASADSSPVKPEDVRGLAVIRVPSLGLPFVWAREGRWELIIAFTAITIGLGALALGRGGSHRAEPRGGAERLIPAALSAAAALTVVVVVGSGGAAYAAYGMQSPNPTSTLTAATAFACNVETPLDSPDVLYAFNEANGSAATDSSGNGRTGTILAGATRTAGSCANSPSLALGGTVTSGVTLPGAAVAPSDIFSIEIWFRTTSTAGGQLIGFGDLASGTSNVADRRIWMTTTGVLQFSIRENNAVRTIGTPATYRDGTWHHAVATLSSSGMSLYVDGTLESSNSSYTQAYRYNPYGKVGYWRVGGDTTTGMTGVTDATLVADIDDAAVYGTTELSAAQVAAHYSAGR